MKIKNRGFVGLFLCFMIVLIFVVIFFGTIRNDELHSDLNYASSIEEINKICDKMFRIDMNEGQIYRCESRKNEFYLTHPSK